MSRTTWLFPPRILSMDYCIFTHGFKIYPGENFLFLAISECLDLGPRVLEFNSRFFASPKYTPNSRILSW